MTSQERGESAILTVMILLWVAVLVVLVQQRRELDQLHQKAELRQLQVEAMNKQVTDMRLNDLLRNEGGVR